MGHLKFSVYNAGGKPITLESGKPAFLLWFAYLEKSLTKGYSGSHQYQSDISSNDVMASQGETHSPADLDRRLRKIETHSTDDLDKRLRKIETHSTGDLDKRLRGVEIGLKVAARLAIIALSVILAASLAYSVNKYFSGKTQQLPSKSQDTHLEAPHPSSGDYEGESPPATGSAEQSEVKQEETALSTPEDSEEGTPAK